MLKKHGVDPDKVTFLEIPFCQPSRCARSRKQIDVAASLDPWTTQLRTSNYAKVLAWNYVESIPEQPIGVVVRAKRDFVQEERATRLRASPNPSAIRSNT